MTVEYCGERFAGWQVQPEARTVQGELQRALEEILRHPVRMVGASRTDAGVHARGQVASCETTSPLPPAKVRAGLNAVLPADVAVSAVEEAAPGFHARFDALGKHYRYRILCRAARSALGAGEEWHVPQELDVSAMREAARRLVGTHDFRAFVSRPDGDGDCTRTLHRVEVQAEPLPLPAGGLRLHVDVVGDGFLYKMVRTLVGTLVQVGKGRRPATDLTALLTQGDRRQAGPTAPAHGLCLERVAYAPGELPGIDTDTRRSDTRSARVG